MTMAGSASDRRHEMACSIARTLEHIGERWTFLILRDAFYGVRRFDDFQADLGVARNILTKRLKKLVETGIMRREQYQDNPARYEYRLTEKGRELVPILATMVAWGDKWEHDGEPPLILIHDECGHPMHAEAVCSHCAGRLDAFNIVVDPQPDIVRRRQRDTGVSTR